MSLKTYRLQFRVSQDLYDKLLEMSIMSDLPLSQVCRILLSEKKIVGKEVFSNA